MGSRDGDTILDPFSGSGTTGVAANELNRNAILIELNPNYVETSKKRASIVQPQFQSLAVGTKSLKV